MNIRPCIELYCDTRGDFILIASKITPIGYSLLCEPYAMYTSGEWPNVAKRICTLMAEVEKSPTTQYTMEDAPENLLSKLTKMKSQKKLANEYVLLIVSLDTQKRVYDIQNYPAMEDGGWGVMKEHLSEQYSTVFSAKENCIEGLQAAVENALAEAKAYLKAIGRTF